MAVVGFTRVNNPGALRETDILGYWVLTPGDTASPLLCPRFADKTIHMFGTWGGATVKLQESNDPNLSSYQDAYDVTSTAISKTADGALQVLITNPYAIKPVITGGSGSSVTVAVMGRGDKE